MGGSTNKRGRLSGLAIASLMLLFPTPSDALPVVSPPCVSHPLGCGVPGYNAFGFVAVAGGQPFVVARRGIRHQDDPTGRLSFFLPAASASVEEIAGAATSHPYIPKAWDGEPGDDARNLAGGIAPGNNLMIFWSELSTTGQWHGLRMAVMPPPNEFYGSSTPANLLLSPMIPLDIGNDIAYSAYGPLVRLPSGHVLQTFYGWDAYGMRRVRTLSFGHWPASDFIGPEVIVDQSQTMRISESAAVALDGKTDSTTRLIMVTRTEWLVNGKRFGGLRQYVSSNGGSSWRYTGMIPITISSNELMPWIAKLPRGRLALVWADRGSLSIKVSIANPNDVFQSPRNWPRPSVLYKSTQLSKPAASRILSDFGYPSIAMLAGEPIVSFYDSTIHVTSGRNDPAATEIYSLPLFKRSSALTTFIPVR